MLVVSASVGLSREPCSRTSQPPIVGSGAVPTVNPTVMTGSAPPAGTTERFVQVRPTHVHPEPDAISDGGDCATMLRSEMLTVVVPPLRTAPLLWTVTSIDAGLPICRGASEPATVADRSTGPVPPPLPTRTSRTPWVRGLRPLAGLVAVTWL